MTDDATLDQVLGYHDRSKHHLDRSAPSPGYLDWKTQPDPFRRYQGAAVISLDEVAPTSRPTLDEVLESDDIEPRAFGRGFISQLFYDSLALSAWKEHRGTSWSLRCNPSSGNLHPTECYVLLESCADLAGKAGVFHYSPYLHALEGRADLETDAWADLVDGLPLGTVFLGLTSIHWREAWKYGERAFRYCQHDVGHAIAAISYAAATQGWSAHVLEGIADDELASLLGISAQEGPEREQPDCLLAVSPAPAETLQKAALRWSAPTEVIERFRALTWVGEPNVLSTAHREWPAIDFVTVASRKPRPAGTAAGRSEGRAALSVSSIEPRASSMRELVRNRRSAVQMDGTTWLDSAAFYRILAATLASDRRPPLAAGHWSPAIDLVLFVHRVRGLEPGLYALMRSAEETDELQSVMREDYDWQQPEGCPRELPLYLLASGDARRVAQLTSCHQEIASEGAFAVAMLAEVKSNLESRGPWFYRRLFWEAGAIGQVLYIEAEAAGLRSTGIGCFFDDVVHELLGLDEKGSRQVLYHLTVGGAVDDERIRTLPPYAHLREQRRAIAQGHLATDPQNG